TFDSHVFPSSCFTCRNHRAHLIDAVEQFRLERQGTLLVHEIVPLCVSDMAPHVPEDLTYRRSHPINSILGLHPWPLIQGAYHRSCGLSHQPLSVHYHAPDYIRERLFKCLPHVRRVTLLCHNVSTNPPLNITWDYNVFFPPNVELLDMLFSYNTTEKPFDQEPCHRFYSKNHYYEPEFYSPNFPIRFDGLKDYAPRLEMPYIRHLTIYGANPAMVILTIELFPALETLHTDIDSAVLKAGFDAANVRPTEGHIYEI
ncbi:hypothetical protein EV421DRAFT_106582, partial [Armillaria borealis]